MCTVPQRENALHALVNDDTLELYLSFITAGGCGVMLFKSLMLACQITSNGDISIYDKRLQAFHASTI